MDVKRHKAYGSVTKGFIAHFTATRVKMFAFVSLTPKSYGGDTEGPVRCLCVQWVDYVIGELWAPEMPMLVLVVSLLSVLEGDITSHLSVAGCKHNPEKWSR